MTMSKDKRSSGAAASFRVSPVAVGCTLLIAASGASAQQQQQQQQPQQLETVTVTGIRKGIEDAISVKRNKDTIVEAISAEDIGKLPDTTIAESLARLPGVTTQRTLDGSASTVSIRGLGPDFNGYLLNGREQTSTGDSRAVDLSVYPAELIAGATVYKTGDAGLPTAGLAGTIDNQLVDPLAFRTRTIAVADERSKTGVGLPVTGKGSRYSLTYIDQFADRTLGIALGFVKSGSNSFQQQQGGWGDATVNATLANGSSAAGVKVPVWGNGLDFKNRHVTDNRKGAVAILSFKPNSSFSSKLDYYWAQIDDVAKEARIQGGLSGPITNATVVNGVATAGTFQLGASPNGLIDRSESIFDNDTIRSLGWKNELRITPKLTGLVDLNVNSAKRVERDIEAYAGIAPADTLSFDTSAGAATPKFTLGRAAAYVDPSQIFIRDQTGWSGVNAADGKPVPQAGYSKGPTVTDKVSGLRFELRQDLDEGGFLSSVQYGLNYTKRSKDRVTDEGVIASAAGDGRQPFAFPGNAYVENNVGGTGVNMLTFDPQAGLWPGATLIRKYNDDILSKTWSVEEKVTTGYVRGTIDTTLVGVPVTGNVGVQLVRTDQSSAGYVANVGSSVVLANPATSLTSAGTSYTDVLPSLNLNGDLGSGNLLRFALSKQIARPNMTDMRNSFAGSTALSGPSQGLFIASSGNPYLKPFKATALDFSFEKYFKKDAYFSAAAFYKKLDTYIVPATFQFDFTQYLKQLNIAAPPNGPIGVYTQTVNGSGGDLHGIELAASMPFNLISDWLDGFGMSGSVSVTESSVQLPNLIGLNPSQSAPTDGRTIGLPGLSKNNNKLTLYFEKWGFSAFVAGNTRSRYVGSVANTTIGGYPTLAYIDAQRWVSAQVGYEFQEGYLKGLGFRLEGNNLNKPVYRQLKVDPTSGNLVTDFQNNTGKNLIFKINYKY